MLQKISKNGVGLILLIAAMLGLDIPEQAVEEARAGAVAVISFLFLLWNQFSRKDLKWGIFRK
jgi:hypothetical protein